MSELEAKVTDFSNVHKIFVLPRQVLMDLGPEGLHYFDHKEPEKGLNLLVTFEQYFRMRQPDMNPFERRNIEQMCGFVHAKGIKADQPYAITDNVAVVITRSGVNLSEKSPVDAELNLLESECDKLTGRGKPSKEQKHWMSSIPKGVPVEVIASSPWLLAQLALRGIPAQPSKYRKTDPTRADDYLVFLNRTGDADKDRRIDAIWEKLAEGKGSIVHDAFYDLVQPFLPERDNAPQFLPNQFFVMYDNNGKPHVLRNKYEIVRNQYDVVVEHRRGVVREEWLHQYEDVMRKVWNPREPLDLRQLIALSLLFDRSVTRLFIVGGAGCGKTSISYLSLLLQTLKAGGELSKFSGRYDRLRIAKMHSPLGGKAYQVGALPGEFEDKTRQWLGSYWDIHNGSLFSIEPSDLVKRLRDRRDKSREVPMREGCDAKFTISREPVLELVNLAELRGMNFTGPCLFDETQNSPMDIIISSLSRVSEGGKLVLMGDLQKQIDREGYSSEFNGLIVPLGFHYGDPFAGCVRLTKNYRDMGSRKAEQELPGY